MSADCVCDDHPGIASEPSQEREVGRVTEGGPQRGGISPTHLCYNGGIGSKGLSTTEQSHSNHSNQTAIR